MSKASRSKGRRGETAAKCLLADRDYTILADTSAGLSTDDLVVQSPDGKVFSVEVKNTRLIDVPKFRAQAIRNAKRNSWLLLCKIDNTKSWLVIKKGAIPSVWHEKPKAEVEP